MRISDGERWLNWGFALALLLHAAALAAASLLPAEPSRGDGLDEIRVFGRTPRIVSTVDLVDWEEPAPVSEVELSFPQPEPRERDRPAVERTPPKEPERVSPRPRPAQIRQPTDRAEPPASTRVVTPGPPGGGGGGGGGDIDLGSSSPAGDLPAPPGGGTQVGEVPGEGTGSGPGVGPGSGGGSGGGTGGGTGIGEGTGVGEGRGSGSGGGEGSGGGGGFQSRVADRLEPQVVSKGSLEYPASAIRDGVQGTVRMKVLVTEKGTVGEVEIVRSSGDRRLDSAAREWVRGWRYRPAIQDGEERRVWTYATVTFELT